MAATVHPRIAQIAMILEDHRAAFKMACDGQSLTAVEVLVTPKLEVIEKPVEMDHDTAIKSVYEWLGY